MSPEPLTDAVRAARLNLARDAWDAALLRGDVVEADRLEAEVADLERTPLDVLADAQRAYDEAKADLRDAVRDARAAGHTWADVGRTLGVRKQTAHERFRDVV